MDKIFDLPHEDARGVVLLSGGMDSATLFYLMRASTQRVIPLSVRYGQRHAVELHAAHDVCRAAGVVMDHVIQNLSSVSQLLQGSSQTDSTVEVPEGHYADDNMRKTVVPNRNMLLLSLATALCISRDYDYVAYAAHSGDHAIYPDCRPEFTSAMETVMQHCHYKPISLLYPFQDSSKADIVRLATTLEVPLALTYSCYKGGFAHCGRCGTCVERILAFHEAGVPDPTSYAVPDPLEYALSVSGDSDR